MIITQTPLRISFMGGGTDFSDFYLEHGGAVVSTSIDKYIFVIIKERFDKEIVLNWRKKEIVSSVSEVEHELIREAMKKTGVVSGVEITTLADIPSEGSGLGSSSSVLVGLLQALYLFQGISVDAKRLAEEACEIEVNILKRPIGIQDQYIAAYGGLRHFLFNKDGTVESRIVKIDESKLHELGSYLMLFYTGISRASKTILTDQKKNIGSQKKTLSFFVKQTHKIVEILKKGNWKALGEALDESWKLKKKLAKGVSNNQIDKIYLKAKKAGAWGGKITGAGGGGFLMLIVPHQKRESVRKALKGLKELPIKLEKNGSKVIFDVRRT